MSSSPETAGSPAGIPVKKKRSPLFYLGMGCLGIVLLTVLGIGILSWQVMSGLNQKVDSAALIRSFNGDLPIYPGAKIDDRTTNLIQKIISYSRGLANVTESAAIALRSAEDSKKIVGWYDFEMSKNGFRVMQTRQNSIGIRLEEAVNRTYVRIDKQNRLVAVSMQIGKAPGEAAEDSKENTMIHVLRMVGQPEPVEKNTPEPAVKAEKIKVSPKASPSPKSSPSAVR